jgi:hypothetical protein
MVLALAVSLFWSLIISFQPHELPAFQNILNHLSILRLTRLSRERTTTAFLISALSAFGMEEILKRSERKNVLPTLAAAVLSVSAVLYLIVDSLNAHLTGNLATARFDSLIWPAALTICIIGAVYAFLRGNIKNKKPGSLVKIFILCLVIGQFGELFTAGVSIPTYSKAFYPATQAELALESTVKNGLVGLDTGNPQEMQRSARVGIYPEANIGYNIRMFAIHDPLLPSAYYASWPGPAAKPQGGPGVFEPDVNSAKLARLYGINYILALSNQPQPPGTKKVAVLDGEGLYKVPNSSQFMLTDNNHELVSSSPTNGTFQIHISTAKPQTLIMHVADEPGWTLTKNGSAIAINPYHKINMSAHIPAGKYTLTLSYWPSGMSQGIRLAILGILIFILMIIAQHVMEIVAQKRNKRKLLLSDPSNHDKVDPDKK